MPANLASSGLLKKSLFPSRYIPPSSGYQCAHNALDERRFTCPGAVSDDRKHLPLVKLYVHAIESYYVPEILTMPRGSRTTCVSRLYVIAAPGVSTGRGPRRQ